MFGNWKQTTYRDERYLAFIRSLPCCICRIKPCDPHHSETGGLGIKASDLTAIPLCRICHSICHAIGRETFQKKRRVDFLNIRIDCLEKYIEKGAGHERSESF